MIFELLTDWKLIITYDTLYHHLLNIDLNIDGQIELCQVRVSLENHFNRSILTNSKLLNGTIKVNSSE